MSVGKVDAQLSRNRLGLECSDIVFTPGTKKGTVTLLKRAL